MSRFEGINVKYNTVSDITTNTRKQERRARWPKSRETRIEL